MTDLERIQIARAEEQMADVRMDEPTNHDRWQIRGAGPGRMNGKGKGWKRERCLACGAPARVGSYCPTHGWRVLRGRPWDDDLYHITEAEKRRTAIWARPLYRRGGVRAPRMAGRKGAE